MGLIALFLLLAIVAWVAFGGPEVVWGHLRAHPASASAVVLAFLGFAIANPTGRAWAEHGPAIADRLAIYSPLRHHYLRQVIDEHRDVTMAGLRTQGDFALRLDQIFVEPRVVPNPVRQAGDDSAGRSPSSGGHPVWDFLRQIEKEDARALAIIGPPGAGKTTLLQSVALRLAADRRRRHGLRTDVPLFLCLRDHVEALASADPPSLAALAQERIAKKLGRTLPPGWFARQLEQGRCLVLLDGLDEGSREWQREQVSAWIDRQILTYGRSLFVVTSRPGGYKTAPLERAVALEMLPFGPEQIRQFVKAWYLAAEWGQAERPGGQRVAQEAEHKANDLFEQLRERGTLGELARNPLLLTTIVTVHRYRGKLPARRVELYADVCDVLLGGRRRAKNTTERPNDKLTVEQTRRVLQLLAEHMMEKRAREIDHPSAIDAIKSCLLQAGLGAIPAAPFLQKLTEKSGLFLERELGQWEFAHRAFQEYLAAASLRAQRGGPDFDRLIADPWWHEVLRLYAAQGDASALLSACLRSENVDAMVLAGECLEAEVIVEPAVRERVTGRLEDDLESPESDCGRLAAEVCLARRLRAMEVIDERRRIDRGYVTCAEYQLFLEEKRARGSWLQPDHWTEGRFAKGWARAAALGVRFEDAKQFAAWLTERQRAPGRYRLPTPDEARRYPAAEAQGRASWCEVGEKGELGDLSEQDEQRWLRQLAGLSSLPAPTSLRQDLAGDPLLFRWSLSPVGAAHLHECGLDLARVRDAIARDGDRDRDLQLALHQLFSRFADLAVALGRALDLPFRRDLDRGLDPDDARLTKALRHLGRVGLPSLVERLERLEPGASLPTKRVARFLETLAALLESGTFVAWRGVGRLHAAHVIEDKWEGLAHDARARAIGAYWLLRIIEARESSTLPAWEGIRLVHEREPDES